MPPPDFELLFRSASSLVVVLEPTPNFTIVDASDAYLRSRRTTRAAIVGRPFFEVFPDDDRRAPVAIPGLRESLDRVFATGRPDGFNAPVTDGEGRMRYIVHRVEAGELELLRSVAERDRAIGELRTLKDELEAFAYSVSHDLRAPVRAIGGFCALLKNLHPASLPPQAHDFVARIDAAARQAGSILEGLLVLSRVDRSPIVRGRVDLSLLAQQVTEDLRAREPARRATVRIEKGLEAYADERLVAIVLENLIGNAWKYTAPRDEARIEVGARRVVGQAVFYVTDNGVGFDMARVGELFRPFSRLHATREFEGHGVGLATVKRVMQRHGGNVWAESEPGRGATFHFTFGNRVAGANNGTLVGVERLESDISFARSSR